MAWFSRVQWNSPLTARHTCCERGDCFYFHSTRNHRFRYNSDKETTPRQIEEAEEGLEYARKTVSDTGIEVETHLLVRGFFPGEDLVHFAIEKGIDQIVVGLKKVSPVGKILFGSNARFVILNAPCPVLSVK
ncbi:MAG: universal stress protein [Desulfomonile sp.]